MENDDYRRLIERLRPMEVATVAFSGGADSSLLLAAAQEALAGKVLALTVVTPYMERQEIGDALVLAEELGVRHELVELDIPATMASNPTDRCYHCKLALYERLLECGREAGYPRVLDGSNIDDLNDYRPGLRALRELGIESPLLDCRLTKADVRRLSAGLGLSTTDKPANACLLTRLPVGQRIAMGDLQRIEEAERLLRSRGYRWVRVRQHGLLARIEVEAGQRARLLDDAAWVVESLEALGFRHVTMDLAGYRLGSMNPYLA
jgi:uncharacterized protein